MALMAVIMGLGLSFYILLGFRWWFSPGCAAEASLIRAEEYRQLRLALVGSSLIKAFYELGLQVTVRD